MYVSRLGHTIMCRFTSKSFWTLHAPTGTTSDTLGRVHQHDGPLTSALPKHPYANLCCLLGHLERNMLYAINFHILPQQTSSTSYRAHETIISLELTLRRYIFLRGLLICCNFFFIYLNFALFALHAFFTPFPAQCGNWGLNSPVHIWISEFHFQKCIVPLLSTSKLTAHLWKFPHCARRHI